MTYDEVWDMTRQLTANELLQLMQDISRYLQQQTQLSNATSLLELEGLGSEIWADVDAQNYVDQERASWQ